MANYQETIVEKINRAQDYSQNAYLSSLTSESVEADLENWFNSLKKEEKLELFVLNLRSQQSSQEQQGQDSSE